MLLACFVILKKCQARYGSKVQVCLMTVEFYHKPCHLAATLASRHTCSDTTTASEVVVMAYWNMRFSLFCFSICHLLRVAITMQKMFAYFQA
jgi:hypothetical protein